MIELKTPCTSEDIEKLKCGDVVKISGVLYTGRDQAHKRMVAALKEGKELPFDVCGQAIYYVGPAPNKPAFRRWYSRLTNHGRFNSSSFRKGPKNNDRQRKEKRCSNRRNEKI